MKSISVGFLKLMFILLLFSNKIAIIYEISSFYLDFDHHENMVCLEFLIGNLSLGNISLVSCNLYIL